MPLGRLRGFNPAAMAEFRAARGLSVDQVAVLCGVRSDAVRRWEGARYSPAPGAAKRLAAALGVSVQELTTTDQTQLTLVDLRQACGFTGDDAAQATGLSKATIYTVERYVSALPDHARGALARGYGVTVEEVDAAWRRGHEEKFGDLTREETSGGRTP